MYSGLSGRMRALLNNLVTSKSSEYVQIEAIECLNTNEALLSIIHIYKQYWWSSSISMVGVGNTKKRAKISLIGCGGDDPHFKNPITHLRTCCSRLEQQYCPVADRAHPFHGRQAIPAFFSSSALVFAPDWRRVPENDDQWSARFKVRAFTNLYAPPEKS